MHPEAEKVEGATWWWPHKVRMHLDDGSVREKAIEALRGSLARPFEPAEQQAKLDEAGKGALSPEQLACLADDCRSVGERGVAPVTRHMRAAQSVH